MNFIDISGYQAGLDLGAVFAGNPLDGVIVKATGGKSHVQRTCDPWVQWLIANDKPWGFYHFLDDDFRHASPEAEADFFVENCLNYFGHGLPCADYEAQTTEHGTGYLLAFLERVRERTGVKCAVYASLAVVQEQDFSEIAKRGYPLWLAQYASMQRQDGFRETPWQNGSYAPFKSLLAHQYSATGRLNGYGGDLDMDKVYCTAEEWRELAGAEKTEEQAEEPTGEPDGVVEDESKTAFLRWLIAIMEDKINKWEKSD